MFLGIFLSCLVTLFAWAALTNLSRMIVIGNLLCMQSLLTHTHTHTPTHTPLKLDTYEFSFKPWRSCCLICWVHFPLTSLVVGYDYCTFMSWWCCLNNNMQLVDNQAADTFMSMTIQYITKLWEMHSRYAGCWTWTRNTQMRVWGRLLKRELKRNGSQTFQELQASQQTMPPATRKPLKTYLGLHLLSTVCTLQSTVPTVLVGICSTMKTPKTISSFTKTPEDVMSTRQKADRPLTSVAASWLCAADSGEKKMTSDAERHWHYNLRNYERGP